MLKCLFALLDDVLLLWKMNSLCLHVYTQSRVHVETSVHVMCLGATSSLHVTSKDIFVLSVCYKVLFHLFVWYFVHSALWVWPLWSFVGATDSKLVVLCMCQCNWNLSTYVREYEVNQRLWNFCKSGIKSVWLSRSPL